MRLRSVVAATMVASCACTNVRQQADLSFRPTVADPAYPEGEGPLVLVDEAHYNYHTAEGRYRPFSQLLRRDGYVVRSLVSKTTVEALAEARVLVIANCVAEANRKKWVLPNPSAFEADEIETIRDWVEGGGSLLLIADHMPFPGATAELAAEFGLLFGNGFAMSESDEGRLTFRREEGTLIDHPVTRGRSAGERIDSVTTFTGQAFRAEREVDPLLVLPSGTTLLLPIEAWEFSDRTPRVPAAGMLQGATLHFGAGRVAVFGEAAMFSAQEQIRGDERHLMGMNSPDAEQNPQFLLNVLHWLSGLLAEPAANVHRFTHDESRACTEVSDGRCGRGDARLRRLRSCPVARKTGIDPHRLHGAGSCRGDREEARRHARHSRCASFLDVGAGLHAHRQRGRHVPPPYLQSRRADVLLHLGRPAAEPRRARCE